jgi:hypothetical protein
MGVASRLKFRIGFMVDEYPSGLTTCRIAEDALREVVEVPHLVEQRIALFSSGARGRLGAIRPRLFDERGDVRGRDGVRGQSRLDAVEPEGCQHEQPRDERYEQPRHTAK